MNSRILALKKPMMAFPSRTDLLVYWSYWDSRTYMLNNYQLLLAGQYIWQKLWLNVRVISLSFSA
jgi:hypothetical protein